MGEAYEHALHLPPVRRPTLNITVRLICLRTLLVLSVCKRKMFLSSPLFCVGPFCGPSAHAQSPGNSLRPTACDWRGEAARLSQRGRR